MKFHVAAVTSAVAAATVAAGGVSATKTTSTVPASHVDSNKKNTKSALPLGVVNALYRSGGRGSSTRTSTRSHRRRSRTRRRRRRLNVGPDDEAIGRGGGTRRRLLLVDRLKKNSKKYGGGTSVGTGSSYLLKNNPHSHNSHQHGSKYGIIRCDPTTAVNTDADPDPDLGILSQCPRGYYCIESTSSSSSSSISSSNMAPSFVSRQETAMVMKDTDTDNERRDVEERHLSRTAPSGYCVPKTPSSANMNDETQHDDDDDDNDDDHRDRHYPERLRVHDDRELQFYDPLVSAEYGTGTGTVTGGGATSTVITTTTTTLTTPTPTPTPMLTVTTNSTVDGGDGTGTAGSVPTMLDVLLEICGTAATTANGDDGTAGGTSYYNQTGDNMQDAYHFKCTCSDVDVESYRATMNCVYMLPSSSESEFESEYYQFCQDGLQTVCDRSLELLSSLNTTSTANTTTTTTTTMSLCYEIQYNIHLLGEGYSTREICYKNINTSSSLEEERNSTQQFGLSSYCYSLTYSTPAAGGSGVGGNSSSSSDINQPTSATDISKTTAGNTSSEQLNDDMESDERLTGCQVRLDGVTCNSCQILDVIPGYFDDGSNAYNCLQVDCTNTGLPSTLFGSAFKGDGNSTKTHVLTMCDPVSTAVLDHFLTEFLIEDNLPCENGCMLCPPGYEMLYPDQNFTVPSINGTNDGTYECGYFNFLAQAGYFQTFHEADLCTALPSLVFQPCGCHPVSGDDGAGAGAENDGTSNNIPKWDVSSSTSFLKTTTVATTVAAVVTGLVLSIATESWL